MKKTILILTFIFSIFTTPAFAADLLMIHSDTCPICIEFMRQVGRAYDAHKTGLDIPLKVLDIDDVDGRRFLDMAIYNDRIKQVPGFPTFILMSHGKEIDRIVGYSTKERFYEKLDAIVKKHVTDLAD